MRRGGQHVPSSSRPNTRSSIFLLLHRVCFLDPPFAPTIAAVASYILFKASGALCWAVHMHPKKWLACCSTHPANWNPARIPIFPMFSLRSCRRLSGAVACRPEHPQLNVVDGFCVLNWRVACCDAHLGRTAPNAIRGVLCLLRVAWLRGRWRGP